MRKKAWVRLRHKLKVIFFAFLGAGVLFQPSCANLKGALKKAERVLWLENYLGPIQFQSEEYVAYRLRGDETPVALADEFLKDSNRSWVIEDANEGIPWEKGQLIVIPLKSKNKGGLTMDSYQVVPILSYHHFAKNCWSHLCVSTNIFDRHMSYLKENGYRVITMSELLGFLHYRHAIPKRSVVITIDDGYRSAYDIAYPVLKKHGFTATLFIYTDYIGVSTSSLTWDQLREMKADGFEVGSHTLSHCDLTKKQEGENNQAYIARIKGALLASKHVIDKELEQDTIFLAYPYGRYDATVLYLCEQTGYKIGVSTRAGGNAFFTDPLMLDRNQILKSDMYSFVSNLKTFNTFSLK